MTEELEQVKKEIVERNDSEEHEKYLSETFGGLQKISSEEMYKKEHKIFKKKLNRLIWKKSFKMVSDPSVYLEEVFYEFDRAEYIGLFSKEWCFEQRLKFLKEVNNPAMFKQWLVNKKEQVIKKFNKKK